MGWERKRGKLHELNRLLRGATDTTFLAAAGAGDAPPAIRYVITLDADTRLPARRAPSGWSARWPTAQPAALRPAGRPGRRGLRRAPAADHATLPADRGQLALPARSLRAGRASIPTRPRSPTSTRISSAKARTPARGSTTSTPSRRRWPAACRRTSLLSHDLFEGIFARAGLVTDVELFEEFPSALRGRRRAPAPLGARRLAAAAMDLRDCRTALSPPSAAGRCWTTCAGRCRLRPPSSPCSPAGRCPPPRPGCGRRSCSPRSPCPRSCQCLGEMIPQPARHLQAQPPARASAGDLVLAVSQVGLGDHLPRAPGLADGGRDRAHARRGCTVTHRRLLEWVTAAQAKAGLDPRAGRLLPADGRGRRPRRAARPSLVAAVRPGAWPWRGAVPPAAGLAAPAVARWISLPPRRSRTPPLSREDATALRLLARRTWRFFETFVGPEDHALPPDNFQEDPQPGRRAPHLAHQHRALPAVDRRRARLRLARHRWTPSNGSRRRWRR